MSTVKFSHQSDWFGWAEWLWLNGTQIKMYYNRVVNKKTRRIKKNCGRAKSSHEWACRKNGVMYACMLSTFHFQHTSLQENLCKNPSKASILLSMQMECCTTIRWLTFATMYHTAQRTIIIIILITFEYTWCLYYYAKKLVQLDWA